jgi:uncharacterized protein (DUF2267 family)
MSSTGLDVFDKTLQTTNIWLDEIMGEIGPNRQIAWHALQAVLRTVRDRVPIGLAAHLGSQLPILVRGAYYDQWQPAHEPTRTRTQDAFLQHVQEHLRGVRPINARNATIAVFDVLSRHLTRGQAHKVRDALPADVQVLWHLDQASAEAGMERAERGRTAQNAADARAFRVRPEGQRPGRTARASKPSAAGGKRRPGSAAKKPGARSPQRGRRKPAA